MKFVHLKNDDECNHNGELVELLYCVSQYVRMTRTGYLDSLGHVQIAQRSG